MSPSVTNLSNNTFLVPYNTTSYGISITGLFNSANAVSSVTTTGGTVSNATGSGTFTFTVPIHKNNTGNTRTISCSTVFTRPSTVTGTQYTAIVSGTTSSVSASFTYPTYWLWTDNAQTIPTRSTIVTGSSPASGVTSLGNQIKTFAATINPGVVGKTFWFAVRTAASQPTIFKTGNDASLLSAVSVAVTTTVMLEPDSIPTDGTWSAESYTIYGINLQAGNTYVSIS